jgi:hypothetical protein
VALIREEAKKNHELWELRVKELERKYLDVCPFLKYEHYRGLGEVPKTFDCIPTSSSYRPEADEAYRLYEDAVIEYRDSGRQSWMANTPENVQTTTEVELATKAKRSAQWAFNAADAAVDSAKNQARIASDKLPEGLLDMPPHVVEQLLGLDPTSLDDESFFEVEAPDCIIAGMVRGEIPIDCPGCDKGYAIVQVAGVRVVLDDEVRHPICQWRSGFDDGSFVSFIDEIVPETFARHRLHSLSSWEKNPIRDNVQAALIAKIPSRAEDVKGWIMFGRGGTSKTTYAAAAIIDMLTFRCLQNHGTDNLNCWRVKVPTWLREMEAYDSRSYKGPAVATPDTAPHRLEETTEETGLAPILWLEELDKFKRTDNRLNMIYSLVDTVYEAGGTIITTTNSRPAELEEHLGVPLYRRLTGVNDADDGKFISVNGWLLPSREEKK